MVFLLPASGLGPLHRKRHDLGTQIFHATSIKYPQTVLAPKGAWFSQHLPRPRLRHRARPDEVEGATLLVE